jgi:hypothetical protein
MSDITAGNGISAGQEITPVPTTTPGEIVENRRANYNRLVRQARLSNLLLDGVNFKIHAEALGVKKVLLTRSITSKVNVMSSGVDDGNCFANIVWEVVFRYKRRVVMKCTASYLISYEGIKDCSEETIRIFVEHVGKVATYAYFRSLYAQLDWASMYGSEPLPILQMHPKL